MIMPLNDRVIYMKTQGYTFVGATLLAIDVFLLVFCIIGIFFDIKNILTLYNEDEIVRN